MKHLQVQWTLQNLLKGCQLELPFPEIKRIADVVWVSEKLIFEVQCSPIEAKEVIERNRDYGSLGYTVVWILHDSRFNKWRLSAAESVLEKHLYYFTNIDRNGDGIIYDQYSFVKWGIRRETMGPLKVDLKNKRLCDALSFPAPKWLQERLKRCSFHFKGDLADTKDACKAALQMEEKWDKILNKGKKRSFLYRVLVLPYLFLFRYVFDSVCREP